MQPQRNGLIDGHTRMRKERQQNVNYRTLVVGIWAFTVQVFQPFCMFENFYDKMLGKIGRMKNYTKL